MTFVSKINFKTRCLTLLAAALLGLSSGAPAAAQWQAVDSRIKPTVYQLNVAIRVKLKDGQFAQIAALSPRRKYPVFISVPNDQGFRVVGHGSCFPVRTRKSDKQYLLTNKHVVDFGSGMLEECERFFAAAWLYAERSSMFGSTDARYKDIMRILNTCTRKNASAAQQAVYKATADTIWDTYDDHLSLAKDPQRKEFKRCLEKTGVKGSIGLFVHMPGHSAQPAVVADLYKQAKRASDPDLAVLSIKPGVAALELDTATPQMGQQVRSAGYPVTDQPAKAAAKISTPSFTSGVITRVNQELIHFDAPVSKGDSGGPLYNKQGKVVGVVSRRAMSDARAERFAKAISARSIKAFVPELFGGN